MCNKIGILKNIERITFVNFKQGSQQNFNLNLIETNLNFNKSSQVLILHSIYSTSFYTAPQYKVKVQRHNKYKENNDGVSSKKVLCFLNQVTQREKSCHYAKLAFHYFYKLKDEDEVTSCFMTIITRNETILQPLNKKICSLQIIQEQRSVKKLTTKSFFHNMTMTE